MILEMDIHMYEADECLKRVKRIHFIGIGGSGMCPLAEILHSQGYMITGSDNNETDTLRRVRSLGIPVAMGQRAGNIKGAEMIVYTAAIMDDNEELIAARASGIPTFERSKLLGALSRRYGRRVGISGTHGKTTTTSLLTQILIEEGMSPNAVIGGKLPLTGTNGITGDSDMFIVEACEFSNTFLELSPTCAVILNVDNDHLSFFKTMENLERSFTRFANMAGTVIYNGDDENTKKVIADADKDRTFISFGLGGDNDWRAENTVLRAGAYPEFDVIHRGSKMGRAVLSIPGRHNVINALAALAAADYLGADIEKAILYTDSFKGAGRRFEKLGCERGVTVIDDYAHHPAELEATLKAARSMDYNNIIAVFQPFTFSRTFELMDDFARVLQIADRVLMTEIMGAREKNTYNVYTSDLAARIPGSEWFPTFGQVADRAVQLAGAGDMIITLGCGDVYKVAKLILERLKEGRR